MRAKRIVVVGAGGFAREVRWLIEEINRKSSSYQFLGHVVSDLGKLGEHDSPTQILGDFDWLLQNRSSVDALAMGIGTPALRIKLASQLQTIFPAGEWPPLVHPTVLFDTETIILGRGVILCAGVIATVNVAFRDFCMCNLSCTVGHESDIGEGSVLNPTVNISGGVSVGSGVLIGTGAQVLQYLSLGDGAVVGAGAVVTKNVPAGLTVVGTPAKPLLK